jgi:hypothetical protein
MKNVIVIMALFLSTTAVAEKPYNAIQVTTETEYHQTFRTVGKVLTQRGFVINHSDINLGVINTAEKVTGNHKWSQRYLVTVDENVVTLWLEWWDNVNKEWNRITSDNRLWSSIERLANDIGGEIEYTEQGTFR